MNRAFSFLQGPIKTEMTAVTRHDVSDGTVPSSRRVLIHWTTSHTMNVTRHKISVSPVAPPCGDVGGGVGECVIRRGESGFDEQILSLELDLGVKYVVSVVTTNCGMQSGRESDPIIITLDCECFNTTHTHSQVLNEPLLLSLYTQTQLLQTAMHCHTIEMVLSSILKQLGRGFYR